jgi:rhodanese-related sulfurtransferase/peroxiredoxin
MRYPSPVTSLFARLERFARWAPPAPGEVATPLSLTADDGSWVKLTDLQGQMYGVLCFVQDLEDPETVRTIRALDAARERLRQLDAAAFGVHTSRTDALRAWKASHDISMLFLYDPLAAAARGFRASGRILPACRSTTVIVGKDGRVAWAKRGPPDTEEVLTVVASREGRPVPARDSTRTERAWSEIAPGEALALLQQEGGRWLLVDVRPLEAFAAGHAPGARHIPLEELPRRYAELGAKSRLIFACSVGERSAEAASIACGLGATDVYSMAGGMTQWTGTLSTEASRG